MAMFAVKDNAVGEDKENNACPQTFTRKGIDTKGDPQSKAIQAPPPSEAEGNALAYQQKCSIKSSCPEEGPAKEGPAKEGPAKEGPAKSVSFSEKDQVNVFSCPDENDDDEVGERPWFSEHKEALVLLGIVAGFSASLMAVRRSFRQ